MSVDELGHPYIQSITVLCCVILCKRNIFDLQSQKVSADKDHAEKPVKSAFDQAGYDKDLVETLERDILQQNPNVKW